MSSARGKATLIRQWGLLELLRPAKRGLTARDILARAGGAKATLYRDLATLREAGVPLQSETVNGEVRHSRFLHNRYHGGYSRDMLYVALKFWSGQLRDEPHDPRVPL